MSTPVEPTDVAQLCAAPYRPLHAHVRRNLPQRSGADDVAQEACLRLLSNGRTYLYRVAHTLMASHYRQRQRRRDAPLEDSHVLAPVDPAPQPVDLLLCTLELYSRHASPPRAQVPCTAAGKFRDERLPDGTQVRLSPGSQVRDTRMAQVLASAPAPALLIAGRWHVLRGTGVPGYLPPGAAARVIALASPDETVDATDADLLWVLGDE
ncbi:sigma factor [Stenotrophomonas beteli]|uniref:RNA polymerase sigma-70 region 2 domain-containing protein n=1 Tax=Stenotrophomonas beteli TaxID=3384461 RepID=A0A0R0B3A3_9GAMM|nr:sigma factor [Stenotrophomonas maltophilia]KRG48231.1 hypothetical protein ARC23_17260 [Stenotrophomonas maltophilia]